MAVSLPLDQPNEPATGRDDASSTEKPASTEEWSIAWLKTTVTGWFGAAYCVPWSGVTLETAGLTVVKLQAKSCWRTPSASEVRPAAILRW